jgi:proline dehydrogenase
MIGLAKNATVSAAMQSSSTMRRLASQFVGGTNRQEVLEAVARQRERGVRTSLFSLGEYIQDQSVVERCVSEVLTILPQLHEGSWDTHISIDPSQMGSSIDWELCVANVQRVAHGFAQLCGPKRRVLMLDMEDSSITERTLELWKRLHSSGYPVAITIQAYLRRSERDLLDLVGAGATVRLVKGALAEKADAAYTTRSDIDASYRALTDILLSERARAAGVYPAFGTHDEHMIDHAAERASTNGWQGAQWEIEMLFGVREALQRELLARGLQLRLYMPFGKDFWAYSIRRIGESPKNLRFVLRAMRGAMGESDR